MTVRGSIALFLDAVAWAVFVERGESDPSPSRSHAVRELLRRPGDFVNLKAEPHTCPRCAQVFGAPYCWEHGKIRD